MVTRAEIIAEIKAWADGLKNPMFSVHGAVYHMYGWGCDSNDKEYRQVYRALEKMVSDGELFCHGTLNGGNIYMLRSRDSKPYEPTGDIPF